jgi:energy-coupling factor transporter ATP-binding protein EcfA2
MQIRIKNCNNLNSAAIDIEKHRLNIKYAMNGTGKSTVARALELYANNNGDLSALTPFKSIGATDSDFAPKIDGAEEIRSVLIFNENYIKKFTFRKDEILENSFEIFVRTPDYDARLIKINELISAISATFKGSEEIDKVITDLSILGDSFGKSKSGYSESGALAKGLGKGNQLAHIPAGLESYAEYLNSSTNVKWLRWQMDGNSFSDISTKCPYCTSQTTDKKETISLVSKKFDAKSIEHLNKILEALTCLGKYFSEDANEKLFRIANNSNGLGKEEKDYLLRIKGQIETLKSKLLDLKGITYFSLKDAEKVGDYITKLRIDLGYLPELDSESTKELVSRLNEALDTVLGKISQLQGEVAQQNRLIKNTIETNSAEINEFLSVAGYKYYVDAVFVDGTYKMRLRHIDFAEAVSQAADHLSYGEKNAFSLVLFMYECINKNPDLIVLDDPISSFDRNKKYAVLDMLFRGPKSLRDKTTLMMTHDLEPIIDIIYNLSRRFTPRPRADFLATRNGEMSETTITKSDISTFGRICDENVSNSDEDVIKIIYLRRYFETLDNKGEAYQLLSNVLHKRNIPIIKSDTGELPMTSAEIQRGQNDIQKKLSTFDYALLLAKVTDKEYMKQAFSNATHNYEKVQLYRVLEDGFPNSDVINKFINEAFHIENEYIMQINPCKYEVVPDYIINECSKVLNAT